MKLEEYLDLAADSLAKASVHEPIGKPGGPGLWKHKNWQLPAYIQHIANDLREKRGMSTSRAIATAIAAVKRWAAGTGKVDSGTRAAARKGLAEWEALKAKAGLSDDEAEDYSIALAIDGLEALSEAVDFSSEEGGVELAVPTNIGKLEEVEGALISYLKVETDPDDKAEAKSLLQRVMSLIAKDRADAAAGHKIGPAYFADEDQTALAELFFDGGEASVEGDLIYKTILREGKWKYSPLDGPDAKPIGITVVKEGKSDPSKMIVSMSDVLKNFEKGAVEHVTVPTSHKNQVHENTGFTRDLRMAKDDQGRWVLEAGLDFTEPEIKGQAERGTIANTSAGLLFNYTEKESGKKHNVVLEHVALTNRPWLNGMKPFGVAASQEDGMTVLSFSEEGVEPKGDDEVDQTTADEAAPEALLGQDKPQEVDTVEDTEKSLTDLLKEKFGLSEEEVEARLSVADDLEKGDKKRTVADKIKAWEGEKKSPAVLKVAEGLLLADDGTIAVSLSDESGKEKSVTLSEAVEALVAASPVIELEDKQVTDEDQTEDTEPEETDTEVELSADVAGEARRLFFEEGLSEADAIAKAKAKFGDKPDQN